MWGFWCLRQRRQQPRPVEEPLQGAHVAGDRPELDARLGLGVAGGGRGGLVAVGGDDAVAGAHGGDAAEPDGDAERAAEVGADGEGHDAQRDGGGLRGWRGRSGVGI